MREQPVGRLAAALELFAGVCAAVQAAHARGIVHRDLKPANIRVDPQGAPHVLDFGLAHTAVAPVAVTQTGQFVGSLPWAAPEQVEAQPGNIDARTDVYALGVMLYHLLTGHFPYSVTGSLREVCERILTAVVPPPSRTARAAGSSSARRWPADPELNTIVLECLQKERTRRYADAGELGADLRRYLAGEPIAARRDSLVYRAQKRSTRFVRAHPLVSGLLAVLAAALLADQLGIPLVYRWTRLHHAFERVVLNSVLAENSPYDESFLRGVEAIHQAGGQVVLALNAWAVDAQGLPRLAPNVRTAARWGCTPAQLGAEQPWRVPLALQHGDAAPLPSLALAAFAAYRRPEQQPEIRFLGAEQALRLAYWRPSPSAAGIRVWSEQSDTIALSLLEPAEEPNAAFTIQRGDQLGHYLLDLPDEALMERITLDYAAALTGDVEELRRQVGGRIVVIGDRRGRQGTFATPEGRQVWGTYAHATAMDMLLRNAVLRIPRGQPVFALTALAAVVGVLAGWRLAHRLGWCTLALLAAVALCVLAGLWGAWRLRVLYDPLIGVIALLLGAALALNLRRLTAPRSA